MLQVRCRESSQDLEKLGDWSKQKWPSFVLVLSNAVPVLVIANGLSRDHSLTLYGI